MGVAGRVHGAQERWVGCGEATDHGVGQADRAGVARCVAYFLENFNDIHKV